MATFIAGGPARFDHQRRGLRKMIDTGGVAALLFDPGTGKTAVTLDYASLLALKAPSGEARVLVVCPLVAVDTWVTQAEQFVSPMVDFWAEALGGSLLQRAEALAARGGQPFSKALTPSRRRVSAPRALHHDKALAWAARAEGRSRAVTPSEGPGWSGTTRPRLVIEVINLDTLSSRAARGRQTMADLMLAAIQRFGPDLVVMDESHKIKSNSANASRVMGRLSKHVKRRIILTGTVIPHSPLDVFGQWRFLAPEAFGEMLPDGSRRTTTFGHFKARYVIEGGWMGKEIIGFKNLDEMQQIMAQNAVVARKEQALDLPPTTDVVVPVNLSTAEQAAYTSMKDQLAAILPSGATASVPNALAQMMRLRQITSGHVPDDTGRTNIIGDSKVRTIRSLIQDTLVGEKRIVIFCLFTAEIDMLRTALVQSGTTVEVIDGGTSSQERQRIRRLFGSDDPQRIVLVAQVKTMSLAVNELVTASHAVFASMSQQRDDYIQAKARLDRQGQSKPVTFWHMIVPKTIDEVILKVHRERGDLEAAVLAHIRDQG